MKVSKRLEENLEILEQALDITENFDVILREYTIGGRKAAILFVDGFLKDRATQEFIERLQMLSREETVPNTIDKLIHEKISYFELEKVDTLEDLVEQVLSGPMALLIDGCSEAIVADLREYPVRGIEEPDLEKVTRGSRDGFVETIVFNTTLIRRRIRDPQLRFKAIKAGVRSKTDLAVGYIKDIADPGLVKEILHRLEKIDNDAMVGDKSIEEHIFKGKWNPFPQVRYTERPDVAAAHLLEGHVIIITDTSPSVMILPVTVFHFMQHVEDFLQHPIVGTYLRWIRYIGGIMALITTPAWLAIATYPGELPGFLGLIGPRDVEFVIPLFIQFLLLEIGVDLIRMALIHTANVLATSLGLLGAILLGEFAIEVGLFLPETVLYVALAALGSFAIPSLEFSLAIRLFRLLTLVLVGLFGFPGLIAGPALMVLVMAFTGTMGYPYFWPVIPFNLPGLINVLFRKPIPDARLRPRFLRPLDREDERSE